MLSFVSRSSCGSLAKPSTNNPFFEFQFFLFLFDIVFILQMRVRMATTLNCKIVFKFRHLYFILTTIKGSQQQLDSNLLLNGISLKKAIIGFTNISEKQSLYCLSISNCRIRNIFVRTLTSNSHFLQMPFTAFPKSNRAYFSFH